MKKIHPAIRLLAVLIFLALFTTGCPPKEVYTPPVSDCWHCDIKNASGEPIENKQFCTETEQSNYIGAHPGYTATNCH